MNTASSQQAATATCEKDKPATFKSIFFQEQAVVSIKVPDYQRAFSWGKKQIDLFIGDLKKHHGTENYYFGHFIMEDLKKHWEVVDGQQRITTFVLFLMVCRVHSPVNVEAKAYELIEKFSTVSYDSENLSTISENLGAFLEGYSQFDEKNQPSDDEIVTKFNLKEPFTRSQRRIVMSLLRFNQAFIKKELITQKIAGYISAIMNAHCSLHLTKDKAVAVNIFEMHNTRGVALTTLEIVKAMLMRSVYETAKTKKEKSDNVAVIQKEFGEIYAMEEQLAARSFRGEMTMEQLLRLHLRIIDDGNKSTAEHFKSLGEKATSKQIIEYVEKNLYKSYSETTPNRDYAINLAKKLKHSVGIMSDAILAWDKEDHLVGDVLILEPEISCQLFLLMGHRYSNTEEAQSACPSKETLVLWERLLFTRNFHGEYYNLKGTRDNFPQLFSRYKESPNTIDQLLKEYLKDGFRKDRTEGLQQKVHDHLNHKENKDKILRNGYNWAKDKMIYVIYKYETENNANIRDVMKGTISVEHILPQNWSWIRDDDEVKDDHLERLTETEWEDFFVRIADCINGIGNLLLLTPGDNSSKGNKHPAKKSYIGYNVGESNDEDSMNSKNWSDSAKWEGLILKRGNDIFDFMIKNLLSPVTVDQG